jgi:hypothetical protein
MRVRSSIAAEYNSALGGEIELLFANALSEINARPGGLNARSVEAMARIPRHWIRVSFNLLDGDEAAEGDNYLPVRVFLDAGVGLRYAQNRES